MRVFSAPERGSQPRALPLRTCGQPRGPVDSRLSRRRLVVFDLTQPIVHSHFEPPNINGL